MKKLLLLLTNYRSFEKIIGCIPELSKHYKLDAYLVGQMSTKTKWPGDTDLRQKFIDDYKEYLDEVILGTGIPGFGHPVNDLMAHIDLSKYNGVIYDDNRSMPQYQIPTFYNACKSKNIPVIGNSHGNQEYTIQHLQSLGSSFDYCFILGKSEKDFYSKFFDSNKLLLGGLPTNDSLSQYKRGDDYILCITNFLSNHNPLIFPVNFDSKWANILTKLSKKYNKKVVIKQKGRLDDPNYQKNIDFIKTSFNGYDNIEIVCDTKNIDELIANASFVISAPSTLAFKPIQMKIPTILISGSGQIGNFVDYPYLVDLNYDKIDKILEFIEMDPLLDYLNYTIEGSIEFNSTEKYVGCIKKII